MVVRAWLFNIYIRDGIYLLLASLPVVWAVTQGHTKAAYAYIIVATTIGLIVTGYRYLRLYGKKNLDIEAAYALTLFDLSIRWFVPIHIHIINCSIIFILVILFLRRNIQISIGDNLVPFISYYLFYFLINVHYLGVKLYNPLDSFYTLILSLLFSASLLGISASRRFYHSGLCAGLVLLCLSIVGKRMYYPDLLNEFALMHAVSSVVTTFCMIRWTSPLNMVPISAPRKRNLVSINTLPHLLLLFGFLFVFYPNVSDRVSLWVLIGIIMVCFGISALRGYIKLAEIKELPTGNMPLDQAYSLLDDKRQKDILKSVWANQSYQYWLNRMK
ncbi:MAG: hypothetical protein GY874_21875 [Desulfobacteraceae bacterium]|nr:hypothetical protein [Desulfobacteraceae bacterium]